MGQVSITIRGRQYQIACDDGQEAHLARLGRYLDQRAEQLVAATGSINDQLMLVMIALVVADELSDAAAELENLKQTGSAERVGQVLAEADAEAAKAIDGMSARIEDIAAKLSAP